MEDRLIGVADNKQSPCLVSSLDLANMPSSRLGNGPVARVKPLMDNTHVKPYTCMQHQSHIQIRVEELQN